MINLTGVELLSFCLVNISFFVMASQDDLINKECRYCHFLVATFEGLRKTARNHFAGGDTAWEERNLGKYCAHLVEEYEEILEEYYYKHQSSNMTAWLCESRLEVCCPDGHYGKDCTKCPGLELSGSVCFAHGSCHGDGSRSGTGACKCDHGYSGNMCRKCAPDFFEKSKSENSIACEKCFDACAGGCTGAGPKACVRCRSGWTKTEEGCVDIDECEIEKSCTKANEKCVNEAGSFRCECVEGYKREGDECVLDVEAKPYRMLIPPDTMLKIISMLSLAAIIAFVVWRRSTLLLFLTAIAVVLIIFIDMNVNPESVSDEVKQYLSL
uniref:EGF-like domain-containing protein n=1 Tax=Angiostrongylus cantonensis TaxID=6313 RepID=A0A0K0CZ09_ANGCA